MLKVERSAEDFVHRCGRTGRAGKSGKAVTFFTGENHERALAGEFMRVLRDVGAPVSVLSSDSHGTCRLYSSSHVGINQIPKEMDRFPSTIKKKGEQRASVVSLSLAGH
jgi:ATP-dependent RNA helicase DBP3